MFCSGFAFPVGILSDLEDRNWICRFLDYLSFTLNISSVSFFSRLSVLVMSLWRNRNNRTYRNVKCRYKEIVSVELEAEKSHDLPFTS